jgi:hypothetical protein
MKSSKHSMLIGFRLLSVIPLICLLFVSGAANSNGSTCSEFKTKAGMPKEFEKALYVAAVNEPWAFQEMICAGIKNGATVRYLRSGLFRNEGMEIRGALPVKVYFERTTLPSSGELALVPTSGVVRDKDIEVTPQNIRVLTGYVIAALRNEK